MSEIATYNPAQLEFFAYLVYSELLPSYGSPRWVRVELSAVGLQITVAAQWWALLWLWLHAWKVALRRRRELNVWAPIHVMGVAL